jgi:outer membrane protein assembly factor BamB
MCSDLRSVLPVFSNKYVLVGIDERVCFFNICQHKIICMKKFLLSTCLLLATFMVFAGDPSWKGKYNGLKWYQTSPTGMLIVCDADALHGVDPSTGKDIWAIDFLRNIKEDNYDPIENSPMVAIVDRGLNPEHVIINSVNGKVICKTKDLGMFSVQKRFANAQLGAIMFYGFNKRGKPCMMLVDVVSGAKRWEAEKIFDRNTEQIVSNLYAPSADAFLIATTKAIYKVNATTGEEVWRSEIKTQMVNVPQPTGFGFGKMNAMRSAMAEATNSKFFQVNDSKIVYFYNPDVLTAFNIETSAEVWKRVKLSSQISDILYDGRGMIVATSENDEDEKKGKGLLGKALKAATDKNKAEINCYDYATGEPRWGGGISIPGTIVLYSYSADYKKLILATAKENGKNYLDIIDLEAGKQQNKKAARVDGDLKDIGLCPQGLMYRTTQELNILDIETGKDAWNKSIKIKGTSMGARKGDISYIYANGALYRFDFSKGDYAKLSKSAIDFSGDETPGEMELRENGLVLKSDQNLLMFDYDGNMKYLVYRKPPGKSLAGKILMGALTAGSMAMMAANSYQAGYARACTGCTYTSVGGGYMSNYEAAASYERAANDWGKIAESSFKEMNKRFKATVDGNHIVSILTKTKDNEDSGVGIELFNKADGSLVSSVVFNDKKPDYSIDEASRQIYYLSGSNEISCYRY